MWHEVPQPGIQRHVEVRPDVGVNQERVSSRLADAHAVTDSGSRVAAIAAAGKSGKRRPATTRVLVFSALSCMFLFLLLLLYYIRLKGGSLRTRAFDPCLLFLTFNGAAWSNLSHS